MAYLMYARGNINNQITTVLVISYHFTCLKYRPPMSNINSMCGLCIQYQVIPETQEFGIFHQFDTSPETNNESCDNLGGVKKNSTKHILQLINLSLLTSSLSLPPYLRSCQRQWGCIRWGTRSWCS